MDLKEIKFARAKMYHFLSVMYQDEIPLKLIEKMATEEFVGQLEQVHDLGTGSLKITSFLKSDKDKKLFQEVRYDYADLFLNTGKNPAFPYESSYISDMPLTMQQPVVDMRAALSNAGMRKNPDYKDLEDHICVELALMRCLVEKDLAQFEFLDARLSSWTSKFCEVLNQAATTDFYRGLAELTDSFIAAETRLSSAMKAGRAPDETYISTLEKMAAAIDILQLDSGYSTICEGLAPAGETGTINSHCFICLGLCGQAINVEDGIITGSKGLPGDPKGGGRLCIKGANAHKSTYSAYRLKTPLVKENGRFRKASWDEAMTRIVDYLKKTDPLKVGFHRGNDWNNWAHEAVMTAYGTPHKITHRQMCDNPARMANESNYSEKRPWIDYEKCKYIILFGINEMATSAGQRKLNNLKAAVKNGTKLVVVDPRRSETANIATEWIAIKPATDGALAMAMCYVIVKEELYDKGFVEAWTTGFEAFKKRLLGEEDGIARTPEWAAEICGISAQTIERLAREFIQFAPAVGTNSWTGVTQAPNATHAIQAIIALNALAGAFDAPGGPSLIRKFKLASAWGEDQPKPPNNAKKVKLHKGYFWSGWIPAYFEQDVDAGNLKGLVCYFGDPVMSDGSEPSVKRAIEKLEFVCTIEAFMSNTAELCDVIIPDCTYLEQSRVVADWMYESCVSLFQRAIEPMYDSRSIVDITCDLAERLGYGEFFPWKDENDFLTNQMRNQSISLDELRKVGFHITDGHEYYKYKSWKSMNPPEGYGSSGKTPTGKYNFYNLLADNDGVDGLPDHKDPWEDWPELQPDEEYPFITGFFRVLEHEHSSTFMNPALMKACGSNPIWINYMDAEKLGIKDGDDVVVTSPWAEIQTKAKVTWGIRQGVMAAAGGFGHNFGPEGDPKYPQWGGFNTNYLMPPNCADKWTGTPPLKYIKTTIRKA